MICGYAERFEGIEHALAGLFAAAAAVTVGDFDDDVVALHYDPLDRTVAHVLRHLVQTEQVVGSTWWIDKEAIGKKDQDG